MPRMKPGPYAGDTVFADTLSISQLAARWHVSRKSVRKLLAQRQLDFVEINGRLRVPRQEVHRYEAGGKD